MQGIENTRSVMGIRSECEYGHSFTYTYSLCLVLVINVFLVSHLARFSSADNVEVDGDGGNYKLVEKRGLRDNKVHHTRVSRIVPPPPPILNLSDPPPLLRSDHLIN